MQVAKRAAGSAWQQRRGLAQAVDLAVHAKYVLPVQPRNVVLEDASVIVDKGRIVAVVPTSQAKAQYAATETLLRTKHALLPGFVNAHTHIGMSLLRGFADDTPLMEWLTKHIWPTEGRFARDDFVRAGARLSVAEMLRSGTTTFNEMYFFSESSKFSLVI